MTLSPAKQELLRRLRAEAGPRRLADEPIAVLGLAVRLPGTGALAGGHDAYWRLLAGGVDAIGEVPAGRWPAPERSERRFGGFLDQVDQFDAGLFAISPREAATMDPQHRLLLETCWSALEDAGLGRATLAGSATGVFVAVYQRDYAKLATADPSRIDAYTASGTHHSMVAGRLAYSFDLRGPALVVDTACSSSLVALHLACRSLLAGESRFALVGAANLMLAPEESVALSRWGMLAPDGRCKPFDARADGFVRGEGIVALVLARQRDVLGTGQRIRARVLGTAVNQDGHSNGLTAPNAAAQRAVIRAALEDAQRCAGEVGYVEAHGTGTALGDPIEMQALIAEYGARSDAAPICAVGSVKSNLGHLEASAGLAGVVKAIACLEHGQIPATLHFERLNPAIELTGSRVEIAASLREWSSAGPRHAAVSSFGMGGTNAHVILGQAPIATPQPVPQRSAFVLPISTQAGVHVGAHDGAGLRELIAAHREKLATTSDVHAWCASAARGRTHHVGHRVAVIGSSAAELADALAEWSRSQTSGQVPRGVVFCCPGQGGQWLGMGRGLLTREPVFEQTLARCDAAIRAEAGWSVIDHLRAPTLSLERIDVVQPLLWALSIAYAALWRSWGIAPDAVVGHSMGEVAAAQISGRLSLADAATVIVRRSALMQGLPGGGAMLAVDVAGDRLAGELLARHPRLSLAAENGPGASVVAGERAQIEALASELDDRGVRWRSIAVDVASHSPAVDELDEPLARALMGLDPQPGTIAMYSTVEGRRLAMHERLDAAYWRRNLRQRVRLWPAIQAAVADAHELFIELGPHPVLLPAVREGLDALGVRGLTLASGRRDSDEQLELCRSLASLYEAGVELDWDAIYAGARLDAALPGYPFQRSAHWLPRSRGSVPGRVHPFLGERIELAHDGGATQLWTGWVSLDRAGFLRDHLVEGSCVLPGMGSVDLVLAALAESGQRACELRELTFERAIVLHEDEAIELQIRIERAGFELWARTEAGEWTRRVHGRFAAVQAPGPTVDLLGLRERCRPTHDRASFYARLNRGREENLWGPAFAGVEAIARDADELLVDLSLPPSIVGELWRHRFHPALLDACAQGLLSVALERDRGSLVLAEIGRIAIYGEAERAHASWIRVDAQQQHGSLRGDVVVVDETGARVLEIEGLRVQFLHERQAGGWFHVCSWRAVDRVQPSGLLARTFAFVGAAPELHHATAEWLAARGLAQDGEPTDIVHIVEPAPADASAAAQLDATVHACLAALASSSSARMWLVTRGGAPVDGRCDPVQSAVWGLGRVMQVELGRRFARAIDLDPNPTLTIAELAQALGEELLSEDLERELAYRDGQRLAARLEARAPVSLPERTSPLARLDPGAGALITGGLGGLGLRMAEHLLGRGARRLILLGRTGLPERSQWAALELDAPMQRQVAAVRALEARGAEVHVVTLDVADEAALRSWAERWAGEGRPSIRVIVHAAGVQHPRALAELGEHELREDLRAKLAGAVALERVFGEQLDCLLLFSSAASLLPSPLLGGYTAANAFLDGFARQGRAAGRPVCAVAWGLFGEGGMARRHTAAGGRLDAFAQLDPDAAFATLDRILAAELAQIGVLAIDWPAWLAAHPQLAASPYFEAIARLTTAQTPAPADASAAERLADLRSAIPSPTDPASRRAWLDAYLRRQLARVLRLPEPAQIDEHAPLTSLGLDSLMALELRNRVEAETGAAPAVVELLRGISLTRLIELVDAQLAAPPPEPDWEELRL